MAFVEGERLVLVDAEGLRGAVEADHEDEEMGRDQRGEDRWAEHAGDGERDQDPRAGEAEERDAEGGREGAELRRGGDAVLGIVEGAEQVEDAESSGDHGDRGDRDAPAILRLDRHQNERHEQRRHEDEEPAAHLERVSTGDQRRAVVVARVRRARAVGALGLGGGIVGAERFEQGRRGGGPVAFGIAIVGLAHALGSRLARSRRAVVRASSTGPDRPPCARRWLSGACPSRVFPVRSMWSYSRGDDVSRSVARSTFAS